MTWSGWRMRSAYAASTAETTGRSSAWSVGVWVATGEDRLDVIGIWVPTRA